MSSSVSRAAMLAALLVGCRGRDTPLEVAEEPELSSQMSTSEAESMNVEEGEGEEEVTELPTPPGVGSAIVTDGGVIAVGGGLNVRVVDDAGKLIPSRLTFQGVEGTPTPRFSKSDIARAEHNAITAYARAFVLPAEAEIAVPVGSYDVWISHGPEWDAVRQRIVVTPGQITHLEATLHHVVETPGWVSGDFHVHAQRSFDSKVPMQDRIEQFVADGVDVIVSTDHNVIADYAPVIAELKVGEYITSLQGDEITTRNWGHFGAFPLVPDDAEAGRGALPVKGRTPAELFESVRKDSPRAVIDVHHPRLAGGKMGYFHLAGLDERTMRAKRPGFSFDFDALEVLNGFQDPDLKSLERVLQDWFAFLRRGKRITATGNSDTHHLNANLGGYPRNYVQVADDRPDHVAPAALVAGVKAGRALFTTGPFVEVDVGGHGLGDTVRPVAGKIALHVRVRAPAWIGLNRVTVLVDGVPQIVQPITAMTTVRFEATLPVAVQRDGFVVVRVDGDTPMGPVIGDRKKFRVFPIAITNPIWVDFDGDGVVSPTP